MRYGFWGILSFLFREGSSIILAVALGLFIYYAEGYTPAEGNETFELFLISVFLIIYGFVQSAITIARPIGKVAGFAFDLICSILPLIVILGAVFLHLVTYFNLDLFESNMNLSNFQLEVFTLAALVILHDLIINTNYVKKMGDLAKAKKTKFTVHES